MLSGKLADQTWAEAEKLLRRIRVLTDAGEYALASELYEEARRLAVRATHLEARTSRAEG